MSEQDLNDFDLLCIGSGPAGQRAAVQAAKLGKRVGLIEREFDVGGVCLDTGTIPSKTFREAVLSLTAGSNPFHACRKNDKQRPKPTAKELFSRVDDLIGREIHVQEDQYLGKHQARQYRTLRGVMVNGEMKWKETAITRMRLKSFIARVSHDGNRHKVFGVVLHDGTSLQSVEVKIDDGR